jgi:glucose/mannose-6-phosphate isomerase
VIEIYAKGQTLPEKMMYMAHLGDWVSWYLAQNNGVDASEIQVIDYLKAELEKSSI